MSRWRGACREGWSFSSGPRSEPRGPVSRHVALQGLFRECGGWLPGVDGLVAGDADHEGLPAHGGHEVRALGLLPCRPGEGGEPPDMVKIQPAVLLAPL